MSSGSSWVITGGLLTSGPSDAIISSSGSSMKRGGWKGESGGTVDGSSEGDLDGWSEGYFDGCFEGCLDGCVDGFTDGALDGDLDGILDDSSVGELDGWRPPSVVVHSAGTLCEVVTF